MNDALKIEPYRPSAVRGGAAIRLTGKPGSGLTGGAGAYTPEQIEDLIADLEDAVDQARDLADGPYVQVEYIGGSKGVGPYTYRDPRGTLSVNDLVEVPTRYGTKLAKVVALGRGAWNGTALEVTSVLQREVLV